MDKSKNKNELKFKYGSLFAKIEIIPPEGHYDRRV